MLSTQILSGGVKMLEDPGPLLKIFLQLPNHKGLSGGRLFSKEGSAKVLALVIQSYLLNKDPSSESGVVVHDLLERLVTEQLCDLNYQSKVQSKTVPVFQKCSSVDKKLVEQKSRPKRARDDVEQSNCSQQSAKKPLLECDDDSSDDQTEYTEDRPHQFHSPDAVAQDLNTGMAKLFTSDHYCPALGADSKETSVPRVKLESVRVAVKDKAILEKVSILKVFSQNKGVSHDYINLNRNLKLRCRSGCYLCECFQTHPQIGEGFSKAFGRSGLFKTFSLVEHINHKHGFSFPKQKNYCGFKVGKQKLTQLEVETAIKTSAYIKPTIGYAVSKAFDLASIAPGYG